jgi:predicted ATP-grasp superfamily ATP-dependent carboligase
MNNNYLNIRVLVTDSGYKHSLGITRALGKIGLKPYVLTTKRLSLAGCSKYAADEIKVPKNYTLAEFELALLRVEINLIILVGTDSFKKIVPWKNKLAKKNINMITVDVDTQNIAFSKKETYKLAISLGVPVPKTFYPQSLEELDKLKHAVTYPCVIKGLYEVGGNIVDYAYDENSLVTKYSEICKKHGLDETTGLPMLQEYIPGDGCAFFAVYNNGVCGATFQHRRVREYPVSGGASVCAESFHNILLERNGRLLLDSLHWHGVAMVEFKLDNNERPVLMEINPKFWGSLDLALEAGVNFPQSLVDIHIGNAIEYSSLYKIPFRYHWPLCGDINHVIENPKNLLNFLKDVLNPRVKSNIWLTDPMPTLHMLIYFLLDYPRRFLRLLNV